MKIPPPKFKDNIKAWSLHAKDTVLEGTLESL
jgi:hypothetical protein